MPADLARDPRGPAVRGRETLRERAAARRNRMLEPPPPPIDDDDEGPEVPIVPVRRLVSLATGGFAALLGVGLIMGAQTSGPLARLPFAIVVLGAQVLYVFATTMALRPPSAKVLTIVGVVTGAAGSYLVNNPNKATITPLLFVAAGGFVVGAIGQLSTRQGRLRITESIGSALWIVIGVTCFSTLLVLVRIPLGTQTIVICLASAGVGLSIARLVDVAVPYPRLADQVPRGAVGIVAGTMMGPAVAGYIGKYIVMFTPGTAAIVGAIAAVVAMLTDLTIGFAEAGRELEGDAPTMWLARHMQSPLAGFALASVACYVINMYLWTVP
jgi:hypothetical protein